MITCTRLFRFEAGHRLLNHEGKCKNLHGHNYRAEITCHAAHDHPELDEIGRVIDFDDIKVKIGGWINEFWDHKFLVNEMDKHTLHMIHQWEESIDMFTMYICPFNPTAENMAYYLLNNICPEVLVGTGVKAIKVVLWETDNCFATADFS